MTLSASKVVDLVRDLSREEAIDLVEYFARVTAREAALQASAETSEHILEMLRQSKERAANESTE